MLSSAIFSILLILKQTPLCDFLKIRRPPLGGHQAPKRLFVPQLNKYSRSYSRTIKSVSVAVHSLQLTVWTPMRQITPGGRCALLLLAARTMDSVRGVLTEVVFGTPETL